MATYVLLSSLTDEGAATITKKPTRIRDVNKEIEKLGVKVQSQYALLGPYDFLSVVEAPDNETIARVSAELASRWCATARRCASRRGDGGAGSRTPCRSGSWSRTRPCFSPP